jgi:diguanylate cyclase (GGDEF)-like protein
MSSNPPRLTPRGLYSRRVVLVPAILLALLVALPWVWDPVVGQWPTATIHHVREAMDSVITLLLAVWILILIRREQTVSRQHLSELEQLSMTDPLTGLGNRRALERELELRLHRSRRTGDPLALLYLDVDSLKRVNDRFGHAVGDETLRCLAAVLRSSVRMGCDTGYRVGGDEFVTLLAADRTGAEAIAGRISLTFPERSPRGSRVSMGVVVWDGEAGATELLDQADSRMYRDKRPTRTYVRQAAGV